MLWAVWIGIPQKYAALTLISFLFGFSFLGVGEGGREMYVEECWEHVEAAILCKMFSVCYTCMFGTRKSQRAAA